MEIADAIAHAMYCRFSPSLNHQTVKELEAILVKVQADLAVQEVQEVPEVHKVQEMDSKSHLLLRFRVSSVGADGPNPPSRAKPLSTHADQMRC